ncbi:MAG: HIRAN domain-containing protein [Muribaculaceae bacterium]|nr:HIRAN domain-containing protein [Muribaculaceae bacterium]
MKHQNRVEEFRYKEPEFAYQRVLFKECVIAGVSFHIGPDDEIWEELHEGAEVALVRERSNPHDSNAVAIALADDYDGDPDNFDFDLILGYVPRSDNAELARLLDAGYADKLSAKITGFRRYGNPNSRLRISIYLESMKPLRTKPNLLRATTIGLEELIGLDLDLRRSGTAYMRFGGFYERDVFEPEEGDSVVAVYDDDPEVTVLYLLRVLATGERCKDYVDDPECLDMVDDCAPYILTNICGPVVVNKNEQTPLSGVDLAGLDPMEYLSDEYSDRFKHIFDSVLGGIVAEDRCKRRESEDQID